MVSYISRRSQNTLRAKSTEIRVSNLDIGNVTVHLSVLHLSKGNSKDDFIKFS